VVFIATGEGKAQRLQDILLPPSVREQEGEERVVFPPSLVQPAQLLWLIDDPAAALIRTHPHIEFIHQSPSPDL